MKKITTVSSLLSLLLFLGCGAERDSFSGPNIIRDAPQSNKKLYISEVLAGNTKTNMDPDFYAFSDWIELHNNTNNTMNIGGLYLSDNQDKPTKWQIPSGTSIAANQYLLVWADKKDIKKNALHTNFKLSQKGETVSLSDSHGKLLDSLTYQDLESDISVTNITDSIAYMSPTPKEINDSLYKKQILSHAPSFSQEGGFYEGAREISLSNNSAGTIFYTTDGSTPTRDSLRYENPITINQSTVIRAIAFEGERLASKVTTKSYFIGFNNLLPVISLATDDKYLFDDMIGIYTEGKNGILLPLCGVRDSVRKNYAQDWSRPVNITYFDKNQHEAFSLDIEFGIAGQCSRNQEKKSFKFELGKKYGTSSLDYKLFEDKDITNIKDFKIRSSQEGVLIADILASSLIKAGQLNVDYQGYRAVETFINGQYWGLYNLREKKGKDFLKSNYPDIDTKNIDIIVNGNEIKDGSMDDYNALKAYLATHHYNLSDTSLYDTVAAQVDIDSFIDYMSFMIYSANDDWLASNHRCWKEKKAGAKWRWMLDDLDMAYKDWNVNTNYFEIAKGNDQSHNTQLLMTQLFKSLNTNSNFKQKFKNRFNTLLDTVFMPSNVSALYESLLTERLDVAKRANIFKTEDYKTSYDDASILDSAQQEIPPFIAKRRDIVKERLNSF